MSKRELIMAALILLLVGLLAGLGIASCTGGDDDDAATATAADGTTSSSTTTEPPAETSSTTTTPSTEAPATSSTTSTPTTTTSTTTSSTTTTTTVAPLVAVVADLLSGEVLGLPHGSIEDEVEFKLVEILGAPDNDTGWGEGCPFDGGDERAVWYEGLRVAYYDFGENGGRLYDGWSWRPGESIPTGSYPLDPQPEEWVVQLHPGVTPDMTLAEIGAVIGIAPIEHLGWSLLTDDWTWAYLAEADDDVPFEIFSNIWFCD